MRKSSKIPSPAPVPPSDVQAYLPVSVMELVPEPMLLVSPALVILRANVAAARFLGGDRPEGSPLNTFLITSGVEFEGVPLADALETLRQRAGPGGHLKLQVRRNPEDLERLLTCASAGESWAVCIEGAVSREDLLDLRAKSREAAHTLNNIVMTAVGNVSLARMRASQAPEALGYLDAAERNLLQVREVTRDLQKVARKDLPLS